jgi:RimJ/RimL family protein N-acetyltransferase
MRDIYRGKLVRLASEEAEVLGKAFTRWEQDSEYHRLANSRPAQLWSEKSTKEFFQKRMDEDSMRSIRFSIRTLAEDRLIGDVSIHPDWAHGDAWMGIAIGERDYWSKGYGTDATRLIVQYGFLELNLHRISLALNSYNPRARRAYEKAGFRYEGTMRGDTLREGQRTDGIFMGILRREWLAQEGAAM